MYKKILIAMALDQGHGKRAVEVELARCLGSDDSKIIAVQVIDHVPGFSRVCAGRYR